MASSQQIPPPPAPPPQQQQMPPPPQQQQQQPPQPPPGGNRGQPPPQNNNNNTQPSSGRGGRGRGNNNNNYNNNNNNNGGGRGGRGGRTSASGRTINVNGRGRGGNGNGRGGGRGRGPPPGGPGGGFVQKLAPNSGIPFGHVPAYLPGSSSLVEELDQRIMVVLRDGRHLVGNLRSFDQYSNMVLDGASERRFHSDKDDDEDDDEDDNVPKTNKITYFTDVPLGMYIVRGDSVVLLGQVGSEEEEKYDEQHPANMLVTMKRVDQEEFEEMVAAATKDDDEPAEPDTEGVAEGSKSLEWDFDKDLLA